MEQLALQLSLEDVRHAALSLVSVEQQEDCSTLKLKFHWDHFPRNFPAANVTGKSPTSYEEVGRVASLLRGSYEEAGDFRTISDMSRWSGDVANFLVTSR